jgi:hypothetical protein
MIHWPMTPEQTAKVGLPIVPRSKVDPTRSAKQVSAMFRDIEERYLGIKRALKALFDQRLTGREREVTAITGTSFATTTARICALPGQRWQVHLRHVGAGTG